MSDALLADACLIRWHATIYYRTDDGTVVREFDLEETADLHRVVELGPHWDTIQKIEVVRINHIIDKSLTVEEALELRGDETKPTRPRRNFADTASRRMQLYGF